MSDSQAEEVKPKRKPRAKKVVKPDLDDTQPMPEWVEPVATPDNEDTVALPKFDPDHPIAVQGYVNPLAGAYDEAYFARYAGIGYTFDEPWTGFFRATAKKLVDTFKPSNVIDVGAGIGILVEALHDLSVEAEGIDVSKYAASQSPSGAVKVADLSHDWSLRKEVFPDFWG